MRGLKRDLWTSRIALASMFLLPLLMAWIPVSAAGAEVRASGFAGSGTVTVPATPTEDATVTALNKEKLAQEVRQLQQANDRSLSQWLWSNVATIVSSFLSTLVVVAGLFFAFRQWSVNRQDAQGKELKDRQAERDRRDEAQKRWLEDRQAERERRDEEQQRWLKDQEAEREKHAEERFQSAVTGLGDEKEGARIGAAILLRTFLRPPDYKQFYTQTFDLAVANLRLRNADPHTPEPLDALNQALITVFKESFPRARDRLKEENAQFSPQSLDASHIQLDNANLNFADLEQAWMPQASCREANLSGANLSGANLQEANLQEAGLNGASLSMADLIGTKLNKARLNGASLLMTKLSEANLREADLSGADLSGAHLSWAHLSGASLSGASLSEARLSRVKLSRANLGGANLTGANLSEADLSGANLSRTNLVDTLSLIGTDLRRVTGMMKKQVEIYKAKGAIVDEDPTISSPQPTVAPPPPKSGLGAQAPAIPPAQGSVPTPETGESSDSTQRLARRREEG
jgi:uncharacterized protein YjbI with pentapeptide repeats